MGTVNPRAQVTSEQRNVYRLASDVTKFYLGTIRKHGLFIAKKCMDSA